MSFRPKFIFLTIVLVTLLSVGITKAAWRDAPVGPPNYGLVSPDTQADYKPMNLGLANQTKTGGVNLATSAGERVGIGTTDPNAKLAIGDTGSPGDTIAAYANSSTSVLYAEQASSIGYAIYASGGLNYFSGNVGIGTTSPGAKLEVSGGNVLIGNNQVYQMKNTTGAAVDILGSDGASNNLRVGSTGLGGTVKIYSGYTTPVFWAVGDPGTVGLMINTGNVGIGTMNPGYKLEVESTATDGDGIGVGYNGSVKSVWRYVSSTNFDTVFGALSNNALTFVTGGVEKMRISDNSSGGNVGIGTPGPAQKLHIKDGDNTGLRLNASDYGNGYIQMTGRDQNIAGTVSSFYHTIDVKMKTQGDNGGNGVETTIMQLFKDGWGGGDIVAFPRGNVGIGTPGPAQKLHIKGGDNTGLRLNASDYGNGYIQMTGRDQNIAGTVSSFYHTIDVKMKTQGDNGGNGVETTIMQLFKDGWGGGDIVAFPRGNVGIGTTDPAGYRLNVAGSLNATTITQGGVAICLSTGVNCQVAGAPTWASITGKPTTVSGYGITDMGSQSVSYANSAGSANSVAWSSITSRPSGLDDGDDVGTNYVSGLIAGTGIAVSGTASNGWTPRIDVAEADTLQTVTNRGSGTTNSITAAGFYISSDARLKKNVETLSGSLEKLGRARGVSYDLASGQGARQIGVIAQELEQEFPELVKTDDNGYKAVAYDRLSAVLIEAIKELKAQNQALQSRLDILEKKW